MNAMTEHKAILKIFGSDWDKNQNRGCRMTNISKFLQIGQRLYHSTDKIYADFVKSLETLPYIDMDSKILKEYLEIAKVANGLCAFEECLILYPYHLAGERMTNLAEVDSVLSINKSEWKKAYCSIEECFLFARNVLGEHFGLNSTHIIQFFPDLGDVREIASSFEEFLGIMLECYPHLCGYDEAQSYRGQGEVIEFGKVLRPKIPYILGGEDSGLTRLDFGEFSTLYADIYTQTKDLPDGAQIEIEIV